MVEFADKLLGWFADHGRHDLPWQMDPNPYRVWISEIMLQQTQVSTVIPYFQRFMATFPDVFSLASAEQDRVLHHWTGLGYYARARNLHKAAIQLVADHQGEFPQSVEALCELPGIGPSTAGAIVALAHGQRATILDGNVKRVLTRCFAVGGWPEQAAVKKRLWALAEDLTPDRMVGQYTQAMMDLGATVCTRSNPDCQNCPLSGQCLARQAGSIAQYPGRKVKKPLPVKATVMYMLCNSNNQVLLEKRPQTGIWGGLWSFPESSSIDHLPAIGPLDASSASSESWPVLRHTFSHYHLDITPVHQRAVDLPDGVMDSARWLWYPLQHPSEVGLAAPVKKLLQRLEKAIA